MLQDKVKLSEKEVYKRVENAIIRLKEELKSQKEDILKEGRTLKGQKLPISEVEEKLQNALNNRIDQWEAKEGEFMTIRNLVDDEISNLVSEGIADRSSLKESSDAASLLLSFAFFAFESSKRFLIKTAILRFDIVADQIQSADQIWEAKAAALFEGTKLDELVANVAEGQVNHKCIFANINRTLVRHTQKLKDLLESHCSSFSENEEKKIKEEYPHILDAIREAETFLNKFESPKN